MKPGLTATMEMRRLQFCLDHEDTDLEWWKNAIWSDETGVVLGARKGKVGLYRKPSERYIKAVVRPRFKKSCDFMFWRCFSFDSNGLCHIWRPETAQEKKIAQEEVDKLTEEREPLCRQEWELENGMRRLSTRQLPGKTPKWKFTQATGKLVRRSGSGVDWYRYQKDILRPKLIPYALKCHRTRPNTFVQEDNAPPHAHFYQKTVYNAFDVHRMLWPGNSPDLNMIEPAWGWMKRETTRNGAPKHTAAMRTAWLKGWKELPQDQIQAWIERIPRHIKKVIELEGGNRYKEGRTD